MADNKPFLTFVDPDKLPEASADVAPMVPETPIAIPFQPEAAAPLTETPVVATTPITRTYYQDMSKVMGKSDPRTMSEILASAHQEDALAESKTLVSPKNKTYLIISIVLLLAGLGTLGFALYRNYSTAQTLQQGQRLSLIRAETHTNVTLVSGEDFKNRDRVTQAFGISIPLQTINHIFFTMQTITGLQRLSFANTVAMTGGIIPDGLAQALDGNFMYGSYQSSAPLPFLILRVTDYDDAFAGTRAWEPLMVDHLGFMFNLPQELRSNLNKSTFEDRVIANHTVRAVVYHAEQPPTFEELPPAIVPDTTTENTPTTDAQTPTPQTSPTTTTEEPALTETTPPVETLPAAVETMEPKSIYEEGDIVLMYTFLNERTILFTTSESVLREILFRSTNAQLLI